MSFLYPAALWGSLLLAIPIAVHIFKPRAMRATPFSSLRWLRRTQQRLSRRIRWHQVLLFLVRAVFVILLVLALARPLFGPGESGKPIDRFLILDVSRSMGYQPGSGAPPFERARQALKELIEQARPDDRTTVLLVDAQTRVLIEPTHDPAARLGALDGVQPGNGETALASALTVIRSLLNPDARTEIVFFTDNPANGWSPGELAEFAAERKQSAKVKVVNVGLEGAPNGWIADARLVRGNGQMLARVELGSVGNSAQDRQLVLRGLPGLPERRQPVTLEPGQVAWVEFAVPDSLDLHGRTATIHLEPSDNLPSDDEWFLNLDSSAALQVLLVESSEPEEIDRSGVHLRSALESLQAAGLQALDVQTRTADRVAASDVQRADVVLLADVPELPADVADVLINRVKAGAGLAVFLGPATKTTFFNSQLHRPLQPEKGLFSFGLKTADALGEPLLLSNVRWRHRLLTALRDPLLSDFSSSRFENAFSFEGKLPESDVLAWLEDGRPAIIEQTSGAGRAILFNTTPTDEWSDLSRRKCFVPLIDQTLSYLAGGARRNAVVGEAISIPLADVPASTSIQVTGPDGSAIPFRRTTQSNRTMVSIEPQAKPGAYRIAAGERTVPFVVNAGRGDSVLTTLDAPTLAAWWDPVPVEVIAPDALRADSASVSRRLWPWLLAAAGFLLLLEMYLVHRLCPRANPTVVQNIVSRQGLLRPSNPS